MNAACFRITTAGRQIPEEREPTTGRYYFGIHANGEAGALAKWNGYTFENSESDNVDMTIYAHLHEQPPRGQHGRAWAAEPGLLWLSS